MKNFTLKRIPTLLVILFLSSTLYAQTQSWQWAKRGGSTSNPSQLERVISMAIDPNNNTYTLAAVGPTSLTLESMPQIAYSSSASSAPPSYIIAKYNCNGTYKWSKVIGGYRGTLMTRIRTDAIGHIITAGVARPSSAGDEGIHFGNDTILPVTTDVTNQYNKSLFIVQYDTIGQLKWLRMPQAANISEIDALGHTTSVDISVDAVGNSHWLCYLRPGTYADGAFTVTQESYHILKYDVSGNFLGEIPLDFQSSDANISMQRNHTSGTYYITGEISFPDGGTASIAGIPVNHSRFIVAYNSTGTFLWKKENTGVLSYSPGMGNRQLCFDSANNIYLSGVAGYADNTYTTVDSFAGAVFEGTSLTIPIPYVLKLSPEGNLLWSTYGQRCTPTDITMNGNEVAVAISIKKIVWQTINIPETANNNRKPSIVRFDSATGNIIAINQLNGSNNDDYATTLVSDSQGNYYMGGLFISNITVGNNTISNSAGPSDFFMAKFGTANCNSLGVDDSPQQQALPYPNPVRERLFLQNDTSLEYGLYSVLGTAVRNGSVAAQGSISFDGLATGIYLLRLVDPNGRTSTVKVVKE